MKKIDDIKVSITLKEEPLDGEGKLRYFRGTLGNVVKRWMTDPRVPSGDLAVVTARIDGNDLIGEEFPTFSDLGPVMDYICTFAAGVMAAHGKRLYRYGEHCLEFSF